MFEGFPPKNAAWSLGWLYHYNYPYPPQKKKIGGSQFFDLFMKTFVFSRGNLDVFSSLQSSMHLGDSVTDHEFHSFEVSMDGANFKIFKDPKLGFSKSQHKGDI